MTGRTSGVRTARNERMEQNPSRRERQERTREALLRAAAEVFAKRGFHAATLPEIARAAGCSTGAVYSNFEGKEDLFLALLGLFTRSLRNEQDTTSESEDAAPAPTSDYAARRWTQQLDEHPETMLLLVEFWLYAVRNPRVRPRLAEGFDRVRDEIAALITQTTGVPAPHTLDAAFAAQALGYGYAMLHAIDPGPESRERFRKAVGWLHDGVTAEADG